MLCAQGMINPLIDQSMQGSVARSVSKISKQKLNLTSCLLPLYLQSLLGRKLDFPCGSVGKESACNTGDLGSILGLESSLEKGKAWRIPWRRERLPTPVFWPGELYGLYGPWGHKQLDMTEQLSLWKVVKNMSF